ncbi:MAG: hypothetical protein AAGI52_17240 [Bacteroidota bacterium]
MLQSLRLALAERRRQRIASRVSADAAAQRARAGASLLDDEDPGWAARLDSRQLELADGQACVLGQLHGDYRRGLFRSRVLNTSSAPSRFVSPVDLGFQAVSEGGPEAERLDYVFLTRAWREEIRTRTDATFAEDVTQGSRATRRSA